MLPLSTAVQAKAQSQARSAGSEAAALRTANAQLHAQLQAPGTRAQALQEREAAQAAHRHLQAALQEQEAACASLTAQNRWDLRGHAATSRWTPHKADASLPCAAQAPAAGG